MYFLKNQLRKTCLNKCLKSHVSEDPSTYNIADGSINCCNLNDSVFTIFINHRGGNYVGKTFF